MINTEELKINNKSYTNKDFQKIYPEILELAQALSAKWDPATSNESDPGVVLLKLLGFVADKLNYNIDKNILEAFLPSATQESAVRSNVERSGYYPRYYQSATTNVAFMYVGNNLEVDDSFTLKAMDTVVTDSDGDVVFTLIEDVVIGERYKTTPARAIEGTLETLTINDVDEIHLSNLDDNNRIYFPERMVAENGVFIENITQLGTYWTRVDNLNISEPNQTVYKFGFDSSQQLPYVEFPDDISALIGEGLHIRYVKTGGTSGNIKAGFLTRIVSPSKILSDNGTQVYPDANVETEQGVIIVNNTSGAINGKDPETINDIYNSFKKTVGTFDTLVTTRDYANAIYQMDDLISNIQVGDRRTDINFSNQILTFGASGGTKINDTNPDIITASNLVLYPLKPPTTDYFSHESYRRSFEPLNIDSEVETITRRLEQDFYKTISQDYKGLVDNDIYLYKVYYNINAKITTNYKVNVYEESSILENINLALIRKFNSREVDYGYEIPFDTILETIQGADTRIKNVSLEEPDLVVKVMSKSGEEKTLFEDDKEKLIEVLTKNILAGRVALFDYNDDFIFEFGQEKYLDSNNTDYIHNNIKTMSTEVKILNSSLKTGYELRDNEYIQVIAPSLVTEIAYQPYTNYYWSGDDVDEGKEEIITTGDFLIVEYADSNETRIAVKYTADSITTYKSTKDSTGGEDEYIATGGIAVGLVEGEQNIIKPVGFVLKKSPHTTTGGQRVTKKIKFLAETQTYPFMSLGTSETLEKRKFVKTTLKSKSLPCYWITNKTDNALFTSSDDVKDDSNNLIGYEVVLGDNEYFLYSNPALTELEVLGSGTRLFLSADSSTVLSKWKMDLSNDSIIDITEVSDLGLGAFSKYSWKYNDLSDNNLTVSEMTILTLGKGDVIKLTDSNNDFTVDVDNSWEPIPNDVVISYTIKGESQKPLDSFSSEEKWKMRSRLDINAGPDKGQTLLTNHTITFKLEGGSIREIIGDNGDKPQIAFNALLQMAGGLDLDMEVSYVDGKTGYDISAYSYKTNKIEYENKAGAQEEVKRGTSGYIQIPFSTLKAPDTTIITLPLVSYYDGSSRVLDSDEGKTHLIMFYWNSADGGDTVTLEADGNKIRKYNGDGGSYTSSIVLSGGIHIIEFKELDALEVEITTVANSVDTLTIGIITVTEGFNGSLGLSSTTEYGALLTEIKGKDENGLFYYNSPIDNHSVIEFDDLTDARAFFDYNHIANKFTLPQINFDDDTMRYKTKIAIVRTSKL